MAPGLVENDKGIHSYKLKTLENASEGVRSCARHSTSTSTSLASQTPYFSEERERGSGNTAYRKFSQAKECGTSNQIASF